MNQITRATLTSALLLALSSIAMADGGESFGRGATPGGESFSRGVTLTERTSAFTQLNLGSPVTGVGNQFTGTGDLTDARGEKVGTSTFTCITAAAGLRQCSQVYDLPGGKIATTGTAIPDYSTSPIFDAQFAVLGGTGRYVGATGELRIVQVTPSEATLTFRLSR